MRRKHGTKSAGPTEQDAFELGAIYTDFKSDLIAFTAKEGSSYSFASVAARMANLFQAEAIREQLRTGERLPEMQTNGASNHSGRPAKPGYDELEPAPAVSAGTPGNQPLKLNRSGNRIGFHRVSATGRRNISRAQTKRWREHRKQQEREAKRVKGSPRYEAQRKAERKERNREAYASAQRRYWAKFSPDERKAINASRRRIGEENKKKRLKA